MRIALLSSDWQPTGGVATYVRSLAFALSGAGHEVLVAHGDTPAEGAALPFRLVHAPETFVREASEDRARRAHVMQTLDAFSPDVVHVQSNNNLPLEHALRACFRTVKTLHVHDYCPAGTKFHFAPDRVCEVPTSAMCVPRMGYLRCTLSRRPHVIWSMYRHTIRANAAHREYRHLIMCSNYMKQQAVASGFDRDRVFVVPYFTSVPAEVRRIDGRQVFALGRLVRPKGFDLLLEALRRLAGDWRAVIAGEGPERGALEAQARALGLGDRVTFPGWLTETALADAYHASAVVVVPSRWPEPFGIVGLEAMAHARPVAGFNVGGIPEWLQDGAGGSLVAPGDVDALAATIARLLDRPDEAAALARRGRERVIREFSAAAHLTRLTAVYERAIA